MSEGFDFDLVLEPRASARRAWRVATAASVLTGLMAAALIAALPLKRTEVVTVLVDKATGDAERIVKVEPTGIEDQEAVKEALLVQYVGDREGYYTMGLQPRLEALARRSAGAARASLRALWTPGSDNPDYPPKVYGAGAEVTVLVKRITFLAKDVAQVRFEKTLRRPGQDPVSRAFVATAKFAFDPKRERSIALVWENPLGFQVSDYRVDPEALQPSSGETGQ